VALTTREHLFGWCLGGSGISAGNKFPAFGIFFRDPSCRDPVNIPKQESDMEYSLRQTVLPLIHSVARELDAIAEPQPNVLNLASTIRP